MPEYDAYLTRSLGFLLADTSRLVRERFDSRARTLGLTRAQWRVLSQLRRREGINQTALAVILEIENITLGRHIDRLTIQMDGHDGFGRAGGKAFEGRGKAIGGQKAALGVDVGQDHLGADQMARGRRGGQGEGGDDDPPAGADAEAHVGQMQGRRSIGAGDHGPWHHEIQA